MHKILSLLFLSSSFLSFSQDIIVKKDGDSIYSKILEVQINEIKYKRTDHVNGPLYTISKKDISRISYETGRVEYFQGVHNESFESVGNDDYERDDDYFKIIKALKDYNLEETKSLIKKTIDSFCFNRSNSLGKFNNNDQMRLIAEFEGDYLRLYKIDNLGQFWQDKPGRKIDFFLHDFSGYCDFHEISYRGHNYAYLNAYIPRLINSKKNKWSSKYKFTIKVKGHGNAEILLNALKHYNELLLNK